MNFFDCLQRASLFGVAALLVALFLQWILADRVPASWRVWVWRVALLQTALALVPFAPLALAVLPARAPVKARIIETPVAQKPILPVAPTAETAPVVATEQAEDVAAVEPMPLLNPAKLMPAMPAVTSAPSATSNPATTELFGRPLLIAIYLLGIAIQLALLVRNAIRVRRILRACTPLDNAPLRAIAARLNIARAPRLLQSAGGSPFLSGIFRPTIVLPAALNPAHLEAVLAHELAHLRRRDLAWNTLLWALQTLLWFHPLSWVSRRFHALEIESACDALTLQLTPIAPKSYGALLIGSENSPNSPLAAGVSDHFFALQTRLKRLGRAPLQPRRRVRALFVAALLVSFAAIVPIELTARAQTEAQAATKSQSLRGIVRDFNGQPIAGATIYVMEPMGNGGDPRAQAQTDANGKFALDNLKIDRYGIVVFVDAGERGVTEKQFDLNSADDADNFSIKLPHRSFGALVLRDQNGRGVKNVEVKLGRVGSSFNSWMAMPRAVKARYRATTDEAGIVKFLPLPLGMLAQFMLADQVSKPTQFGMGDLRGGQYAPLAAEDALRLNRQFVIRSVNLVPTVRLEGKVTLENGNVKGNILILARRINAAEAAGNDAKREQIIAQTRSNAQGRYVMNGLRPGRYYVWVYPEKQLVKDFVGPSCERDLAQKTNRVDFKLSRGAIIQGVVTAKNTGKPVKGQTMWLFDSQENNQYVITDARGYFKFRALGGKQRLRVHKNGSNSPPPGYALPAKSEFNFTIKNGEKGDFKIALPGKAIEQNTKPTRGIVLGPDGKPFAGATVFYYDVNGYDDGSEKVEADANGRFVLPARTVTKPILLFANKGELTTPQGIVALAGQTVQLKLAANVWASIEGRVTDENQQPIAGVKVKLFTFDGGSGQKERPVTTDAKGAYRYDRLRSNFQLRLMATKTGYTEGWSRARDLKTGQHVQSDITMQRAPKTLAGTLYGLDGKPAKNYLAWVTGQSGSVKVKNDGRFFFPHVPARKVEIRVASDKDFSEMQKWKPFVATGGDQKVVLRLKQRQRNFALPDFDFPKSHIKSESLVGELAPPIRATQWSGPRALTLSQLRGKTVMMAFVSPFSSTALRDYARSFPDVQVIGVQLNRDGIGWRNGNLSVDEAAQKWGFPIAIDAAVPAKKFAGWQTAQSYGYAPYVVIGRDGRVLYAGQRLDRAIELSTVSLAKQ